jgi:hypothetical protein
MIVKIRIEEPVNSCSHYSWEKTDLSLCAQKGAAVGMEALHQEKALSRLKRLTGGETESWIEELRR